MPFLGPMTTRRGAAGGRARRPGLVTRRELSTSALAPIAIHARRAPSASSFSDARYDPGAPIAIMRARSTRAGKPARCSRSRRSSSTRAASPARRSRSRRSPSTRARASARSPWRRSRSTRAPSPAHRSCSGGSRACSAPRSRCRRGQRRCEVAAARVAPSPGAPLPFQLPPIDLPAGMVWPGVSAAPRSPRSAPRCAWSRVPRRGHRRARSSSRAATAGPRTLA